MQEVANDLNISLVRSEQVSPNFWTNPKTGIPYYFAVQTPEYRVSDKTQLDNTPVASSTNTDGTPISNVLGDFAAAKRVAVQSVYNQSNIQAVYDVYGSVEHRDLGGVAADIQKIVNAVSPQLRPGNHIVVRGQIQSMHSAFDNLTIGLLFAAVFVYMLMVVEGYESFLDPLAVVLAPAGCGRRYPADAVRDRHNDKRAVTDGIHHGDRRCLRKFDPTGDICAWVCARRAGAPSMPHFRPAQ